MGFAFFGRHLFSPFQVPDENATYILEPVTNEEYYQVIVKLEELYLETICFQDDQNIMWIQETVEVEQVEMQQHMIEPRTLNSIFCFHSKRATTRCPTW